MDVTQVKDINNWTTTKYDGYIATVLPGFIAATKSYCGQTFEDSNGIESIPADVEIAIAKWVELNTLQAGVNSRSQGVSYSYDTSIPGSIKSLLRPHRRLKW